MSDFFFHFSIRFLFEDWFCSQIFIVEQLNHYYYVTDGLILNDGNNNNK